MFELHDKVALITGAAGGLGDKIARTLHAQGATLALTDMRAEPMEKLKAELGDRVEVFTANLTDAEAVKSLVDNVEAKLGRIDILVNNAGLTRDNIFIRMSDEEWQLVLDVNLTAGFKLARAAVRGMMKRRFGRIIGIASVVGVMGNAGLHAGTNMKGGKLIIEGNAVLACGDMFGGECTIFGHVDDFMPTFAETGKVIENGRELTVFTGDLAHRNGKGTLRVGSYTRI